MIVIFIAVKSGCCNMMKTGLLLWERLDFSVNNHHCNQVIVRISFTVNSQWLINKVIVYSCVINRYGDCDCPQAIPFNLHTHVCCYPYKGKQITAFETRRIERPQIVFSTFPRRRYFFWWHGRYRWGLLIPNLMSIFWNTHGPEPTPPPHSFLKSLVPSLAVT